MIVYSITNKITGKRYIGQTVFPINKRWSAHKYASFKSKRKSKSALHSAIFRYGIKNFGIKIITHCNSIEEMNHREQYYIKLFNTLAPNGYNLDNGGKNKLASEQTKKKMRESHSKEKHFAFGKRGDQLPWFGRRNNEKTIRKMSTCKLGSLNPLFNKPHSLQEKENLSTKCKNKRKIICHENGQMYSSIREAADVLNLDRASISNIVRGAAKRTRSGFSFSYINS